MTVYLIHLLQPLIGAPQSDEARETRGLGPDTLAVIGPVSIAACRRTPSGSALRMPSPVVA